MLVLPYIPNGSEVIIFTSTIAVGTAAFGGMLLT